MTTLSTITGARLRRLRTAGQVKIADLARAYGCTGQNIGLIEGSARVGRERADRYLAALAQLVAAKSDPVEQ